MKNKYIKSGFWQEGTSDEKLTLNLTKVVNEILNFNGYPVSNDCCGNKSLVDLDFATELDAKNFGLKRGNLYHTAGTLKIVLT